LIEDSKELTGQQSNEHALIPKKHYTEDKRRCTQVLYIYIYTHTHTHYIIYFYLRLNSNFKMQDFEGSGYTYFEY
jgi:hypothetical protein